MSSSTPNPQSPAPSILRQEGDYWTITYQNVVLRLKDTTGLQCLIQLLRHPAQEFHVLDLVAQAVWGVERRQAQAPRPQQLGSSHPA